MQKSESSKFNQVVHHKSGRVDLFGTILANQQTKGPLPVSESDIPQKRQQAGLKSISLDRPPSAVLATSTAIDGSLSKWKHKKAVHTEASQPQQTTQHVPSPASTSPPLPTARSNDGSGDDTIRALPPSPDAKGRWLTSKTVGSADELEAFHRTQGAIATQRQQLFKGKSTDALHVYRLHPEKIQQEYIYYYDNDTVVINDLYAKSEYHYLVMPRKFIPYLSHLEGEQGIQTVKEVYGRALWLMDRLKTDYPTYEFKCGFHVRQSMSQIHLHVLSTDFSRDRMKRKEHWNSFTTDFFISPEYVLQILRQRRAFRLTPQEIQHFKFVSRSKPTCPVCKTVFSDMPRVRDHYRQSHWMPRHLELQAAVAAVAQQ